MNRVVPWRELVALVAPHAPKDNRGRPPFQVETMLRIHFMQQWFSPGATSVASVSETPCERRHVFWQDKEANNEKFTH